MGAGLLFKWFDRFSNARVYGKIQVPGYSAFQDRVRQRLKIEMDILDQLVHSKKSLVSKRYNLNRELHDCALHYDRVMQLFCRYYRVIGKNIMALIK